MATLPTDATYCPYLSLKLVKSVTFNLKLLICFLLATKLRIRYKNVKNILQNKYSKVNKGASQGIYRGVQDVIKSILVLVIIFPIFKHIKIRSFSLKRPAQLSV